MSTSERKKMKNKNNSNKIKPWQVISIMVLLFVAAIGWLFTVSARLDNKVDKYEASINDYKDEVQNYQTALTIISTRLTKIETNMDWIMRFVLPPDLYDELTNP